MCSKVTSICTHACVCAHAHAASTRGHALTCSSSAAKRAEFFSSRSSTRAASRATNVLIAESWSTSVCVSEARLAFEGADLRPSAPSSDFSPSNTAAGPYRATRYRVDRGVGASKPGPRRKAWWELAGVLACALILPSAHAVPAGG